MTTASAREAAGRHYRRSPKLRQFHSLLSQARLGSDAALADLLEHYREFLRIVAETTLDSCVRPKVGISDVVQESIIEAWQDFDAFRGDREPEFRSWLTRILVNNVLNKCRDWKLRQKRDLRREVSLAAIGTRLNALVDPAALSASTIVARQEQQQELERALGRLSKEHQAVIVLRYREQLPFAEIGRRMNRTSDAARMLWRRAFKQLAADLNEPGSKNRSASR